MALLKRNEMNYYEYFDKISELATQAAKLLEDLMNNYINIQEKTADIHDLEQEADDILHKITEELSHAFITPIDREDILQIADSIDDIIDHIEDIANMLDMFSIRKTVEPAKVMTSLIVNSCTALGNAINEFKNFKKSDMQLTKLIILVNQYKEEGDRFYRNTIKKLFLRENDPIELMKWKEIYDRMADTINACEDCANLLEAMSIKNN